MLQKWYVQLMILIVVWLILTFLKNKFFIKRFPKFKRLDIFSLFLLCAIQFLSKNMLGISALPFLICGMSAYGFGMTVFYAMRDGQILYKKFLLKFWRIADLIILLTYFVLLIYKISTFI